MLWGAWAAAWPVRTWAVRGTVGLGTCWPGSRSPPREQVLDVQPKLSARVRAAGNGNTRTRTTPTTPGRWRSRRSAVRQAEAADDHAAVPKIWSKRHRDLGRSGIQIVCTPTIVGVWGL